MKTIQRFDCKNVNANMRMWAKGGWCRWSDAKAEIERLQGIVDKRGTAIDGLRASKDFLSEENKFLCVELTKINNVVQPLWRELRERRIEQGRHPQTGEAAEAGRGKE